MKKLIIQLMKFAVVGGISFLIDFVVYTVSCNVIGIHYIIAGFLGFSISLVFNYLASMRFVFKSKGGSRIKESAIFTLLCVIGLGLNELILYIAIDLVYKNSASLQGIMSEKWMNIFAKLVATAIVMVFNFVTRKIFLEDHSDSKKPEGGQPEELPDK